MKASGVFLKPRRDKGASWGSKTSLKQCTKKTKTQLDFFVLLYDTKKIVTDFFFTLEFNIYFLVLIPKPNGMPINLTVMKQRLHLNTKMENTTKWDELRPFSVTSLIQQKTPQTHRFVGTCVSVHCVTLTVDKASDLLSGCFNSSLSSFFIFNNTDSNTILGCVVRGSFF